MAFFSPSEAGFEPKRKFRFLVEFGSFSGGTSIMATKCGKPGYELSAVTEHRVLNHIFKFPGVVKWNDIDVSFIDSMQPNMATKFWNSLQNSGFSPPKTASDLVHGITKVGSHFALGSVVIMQLNGGGATPGSAMGVGDQLPVTPDPTSISERWTLKNAFIKSVKFGDLDYSSDDLVNIDIGIAYDYAILESFTIGQENVLDLGAE